MNTTDAPQIDCDRHHTTLAVENVLDAVDFYTNRLGFRRDFFWGDPPTFAGVSLDKAQLFLSEGSPQADGFSVQFVVGDADEFYEFHRANEVEIVEAPADRPYGVRDYAIRDLDGHILSFGHYIYSVGPPVEIERVDVEVRLEKRLAAVLRDLAEHKRMSLSSCLEEILLHTCEPYGEGVASPHTNRDLRYIQELKEKHGIDYDTHASYRFVEV